MTGKSYPRTAFETWLYSIGFTRGNPFATMIAEQERPFLEEFFVPVSGYDRIRSEKTAVVFALPGGGKSALRVQLAALSLPRNLDSHTLTVELTDFGWLVEQYRRTGTVTEQNYGDWILKATATALFHLFLASHDSTNKRIANLSSLARIELIHILNRYASHLLLPKILYRIITELSYEINYTALFEAIQSKSTTLLFSMLHVDSPHLSLLAETIDTPLSAIDPQQTILSQFQELVALLPFFNIEHLQYLIDRLDEMPTMANDINAQADLLQPLLEYLPLLEMDNLSFKFFLAQELHEMLGDRCIRQDRVLDKAIHIRWSEPTLQTLLNERLLYFSENLMGLQQCCADQNEAARIERELLSTAKGSPRRMLQAASALFETSYEVGGGRLIQASDWYEARQKPLDAPVPVIKIDLVNSRVITTLGQQKLTRIEGSILECLINGSGYSEREQLVMKVWQNGITEQGVDQAISRLRRKLGDDGQRSYYLTTVWGAGFRLQNYEVHRE